MVFNKGKPQGSIVWINKGGQTQKRATDGDKLKWKKAQKKETKNIISEIIKSNIPALKPLRTKSVCLPVSASSITWRNQLYIENKRTDKGKRKKPEGHLQATFQEPIIESSNEAKDNEVQIGQALTLKTRGYERCNCLGKRSRRIEFIKKKETNI